MKDLTPLFHPRSLAIVGCSPVASDKLGSWPLRNLLLQQTPATIYPVNPGRDEIEGLRCYPNLEALPEVPDLVLVMVPATGALDVLSSAESLGVGAAIVFGSGFGETQAGIALEAELARFCESSKLAVCGPNTDGVVNVVDRIPAGFPPFAARTDLPVGPLAVISQSGALVSSLVTQLERNGLGLSNSCAIGNAVDLGVGDYLAHFATDEKIETVLVYAEGIADPAAFISGASMVTGAGKDVLVFKSGRSAEGAAAAASHTGSMVGSYDAFEALCNHRGIVTVDSMQELGSLPALVPVARRLGRDPGVGIISGSGAVAGIMTDAARAHGFAVPPLAKQTAEELDPRLMFGVARNPLDLTGQVVHDPDLNLEVLGAFGADPGVDLVVASSLAGPADITDRMKSEIASCSTGDTPVVVYAADGNYARDEPILAAGGVPVYPSLDLLFGGLSKLLGLSSRPEVESCSGDLRERARAMLASIAPGPLPAELAWDLLELYGIPVAREHPVTSRDAALRTARELGHPVVLKLSGPDVLHKSDQGLVHLDRRDDAQVAESYDHLAVVRDQSSPTSMVTVQPQVDEGVEVIVGGIVDREAGPMVVVGAGGIFTELVADVELIPAPVNEETASSVVASTKIGRILGGMRGRPPADSAALVEIVVALSHLVADLAGLIGEVEMNPVIVRTTGARAVDVLLTRRGTDGDAS